MSNTEELLDMLSTLKTAKDDIDRAIDDVQGQLIKIAERDNLKTIVGEKVQATVVSSERVSYNEGALKKALGAKQWKLVRVEKVDQAKLKKAMSSGVVDAMIVAQNSTVTRTKPYLRLSQVSTQQPDS